MHVSVPTHEIQGQLRGDGNAIGQKIGAGGGETEAPEIGEEEVQITEDERGGIALGTETGGDDVIEDTDLSLFVSAGDLMAEIGGERGGEIETVHRIREKNHKVSV